MCPAKPQISQISLRFPPEDALNPWLHTACPAMTILCRCAGCTESSLGAYAIVQEMISLGLFYEINIKTADDRKEACQRIDMALFSYEKC